MSRPRCGGAFWRLIRCTKRIEQGFSIGSGRTTESRSRLFRISLTRITLWNYTTEFIKTFRTTSGLFIWQSHSFQTSTSLAFSKNRLRWSTLEPHLSQLDRLPLVSCEPIAKNGEVDEASHALPAPRHVPIPNFDIEPMNAVHQADLPFLPHDKVTAALSLWRKSSLVPWCEGSYESVSVFILCSWGWGRWALPFPCRLSLQSRIRLILESDTKITEKPVPWHLFRSLTTGSWVLLILFLDFFSPSELRLWSSLCSWSSIFAWSSLSRDDIAHLHARSCWIRFLRSTCHPKLLGWGCWSREASPRRERSPSHALKFFSRVFGHTQKLHAK